MPRLAGELSHENPVGLGRRSMIPHRDSVADLRRYRQYAGRAAGTTAASTGNAASATVTDATVGGLL
jgi:hypothetical protein